MSDWEDIGGWEDVAPTRGLKGKTAKDFLPSQEEQDNILSTIHGLGEAGANTLSGIFGGGLGILSGTIGGIRENGLGTDEQRKKVEEEAAKQSQELTYEPRTEKGKEYAARAGQIMEQLVPIMPMAAELEGAIGAAKSARDLQTAAKPIKQTPMAPDVPLPLDKALEQADTLPENQKQVLGPQPQWEDVAPQQPPQRVGNGRQMELPFDNEAPPQINVTPQKEALISPEQQAAYEQFGKQVPDVVPEQKPLFVDQEGAVTSELPSVTRTITDENPDVTALAQKAAEDKARELQAKQAVESGQTGELFPDYMNQHRPFELFRDENGQPLSRADFEKTVDNLAKERSTGYVRPEDMEKAYADYRENFNGVQAGLFDQPTQAKQMAEVLRNDAAQRMADLHPLMKAAEDNLSTQKQFLEQLQQQGATLKDIAKQQKLVDAAQKRVETTRTNLSNPKAKRPMRNKQSGGVSGDMLKWLFSLGLDERFSKKAVEDTRVDVTPNEAKNKFLPQQVKKGLADYTKERRSNEDIIQDIVNKNIPDMKDTPFTDQFQAGGLYKQVETNNPIVRKTFAVISDAYNMAHRNIRDIIQDPKEGIPALFRKMNKQEASDIWAFMASNEGKRAFTPEELASQGFNDKQIAFYNKFRQADDFVLGKINVARNAAGKDPITARIGHLAGSAAGDFKKLIYKTEDGVKKIVGIVGADTKWQLDRRASAILEKHPEWEVGDTTHSYRARRESRQKAFEDAVELLARNDQDTRALLDTYSEILQQDAYRYMNAKKHTMQKKGIEGMEGFKEGASPWKNAKEGVTSQIRYIEKMLNWAEMSQAVKELKPLLTDERVNMPNAKEWANNYIDRALGIQSSKVGAAIDGLIEAVGDSVGIGPSAVGRGIGTAKNVISKVLLGFLNPGFLAINLMQPAMSMPGLVSLLKSRGIEGASMTVMPKAIMSFAKMTRAGEKLAKMTPFEQEMKKQGMARNILGAEIFEHGGDLTRLHHYTNRVAELGIPTVEAHTRGTVFSAFAHILNDAKVPKSQLWDIAENLTNQAMTDYRPIEAPSLYKNLGAVGQMAVTLQRFKHNTLSSMMVLGREAARNKEYKPLGVAIATMLAFSGLTGMLGYNEADFAYQKLTNMFGDKPDTLTRLLLDNVNNDTLNYGIVSTLTNMDMSKRFGMTLFPDSMSGALFPGSSRLGDMAVAAKDFVTNPNSITGAKAAQQLAPNAFRGIIERHTFEDPNGLAHNPKSLSGTVQRTETDKLAKTLSLTGLHESKEKERLYQESLVDKALTKQRAGTTEKIFQDLYPLRGNPQGIADYFKSERGQKLRQEFVKQEGNIDNLVSSVVKFSQNAQLTGMQQKMLQAAAARKEGDLQKAKRYLNIKEKQ